MTPSIRPLNQEQRQAARQAARQAVVRSIGPRPVQEHFAHHTISKYSPTVFGEMLPDPSPQGGVLGSIVPTPAANAKNTR